MACPSRCEAVHTNFYFLRQLSSRLAQELIGFTIVSCFSQNKEELILELNNSKTSFFIKASLQASFCCLSFPKNFNRARKNSVDLFNEILMKQVVSIRQYENERSFSLHLQDGWTLLFKMHGNRANIILFQHEQAVRLFRNHLKTDLEIQLHQLDRTIDWSKEGFIAHRSNLQAHYFTFGKAVWEYLDARGFSSLPNEQAWQEILEVKKQLENPSYFITETNGTSVNGVHTVPVDGVLTIHILSFSLLPTEKILRTFSDPILAINDFFSTYVTSKGLDSEKSVIRKQLNDQVKAGGNYISKNKDKLNELLNDTHYQAWGDLVMAHMHLIKPGMDSITLTSFYDGKPVAIKLKKELNAQKNAEIFYRKAKNQQIEIGKLRESIEKKEQELKKALTSLQSLEAIQDVHALRSNTLKPAPSKKTEPLPYHEFEFKGYKIWVGKNAEHNDTLTLKYSYKEDLWLHAKDVPGSHVLIKHQAGKNFPKDVIERAAELAAYNSKRKTESLCPVIVTPKKFVRKRKGDPAGAVVVEREEVILVEPKLS